MKKPGFLLWLLHFLMLAGGLGLLIWSIYAPWASGQGSLGLVNRTIYAYQEPTFYFPFVILVILVVLTGLTGLLSLIQPTKPVFGVIILLVGVITAVLGIYIHYKIEASDVYFVIKFAEVQPDLGVLFMILGGAVLFLDGLIYLK